MICNHVCIAGRLANSFLRPYVDSLGQVKLKQKCLSVCQRSTDYLAVAAVCRQPRAAEAEASTRQYTKGRLTNFLSPPYADSLGNVKLKHVSFSMPKVGSDTT